MNTPKNGLGEESTGQKWKVSDHMTSSSQMGFHSGICAS